MICFTSDHSILSNGCELNDAKKNKGLDKTNANTRALCMKIRPKSGFTSARVYLARLIVR